MAPGKTNFPVDWSVEREFFPAVPHYYGDVARQIMLGAVAIMMLGAPFYSDSLTAEFPFEIIGAIIIVAFAALTNPLKRSIVTFDTLLTGAGAAVFGLWAFLGYSEIDVAFVLRDVIALLFLFAFYFSLKTLRAMILHQIGKPDSVREFKRMAPPQATESMLQEADTDRSSDPLGYEKASVQEMMRHDRGD
jgi:hypothetical protein